MELFEASNFLDDEAVRDKIIDFYLAKQNEEDLDNAKMKNVHYSKKQNIRL